MLLSSIVFTSPASLWIAMAMVGLMVAIAIVRQIAMNRNGLISMAIGVVLLALAAGRPAWGRPKPGSIAVMVDLSPSTRGASFRDRAALDLRIHQLLLDHPYKRFAFADRNQPLPADAQLSDLPADRTVFSPPPADAVLLFSDGQFELPPYSAPTYPVIDPALDHPPDAAVTSLVPIGKQLLATVINNSTTRPIHWTGATPISDQLATPTTTGEVSVAVTPGDRWPENDALTIALPPPLIAPRWWIGTGCPSNWQNIPTLPANASDYLAPSAIVLNNIAADSMSSGQQRHLVQYVRDLGGAVILVGGDHAFAAGGYDQTPLDDLSPLASSPPDPAMRWVLLTDGSGSMAGTPWRTEVAAVTNLLPHLPVNDLVSIGSFAASINWWARDNTPANTAAQQLPPIGTQPSGPTNLAAALSQIISTSDGAAPTQLLLMTDAETELPRATDLATAMNAKKIHLFLLALGHGSALPALQFLADSTTGHVLEQLDASQWISSANQLLRAAMPNRYQHQTVALIPGPGSIAEWNQTWLKPAATVLQKSLTAPMAARWQVGIGQVISIAYPADPSMIESFAGQIAQPPVDPRYEVKYDAGPMLRVTVNALDHDQYLNGQSLELELLDPREGSARPVTISIPQTGPGLYELSVPAPRSSRFAAVKQQSRVLRKFAIAGRYPPEFDAIGNDYSKLKTLADRTGGTVIQPGPVKPIDFHWPRQHLSLASEFAIAGGIVIGLSLIQNRNALRR